MSDPIVAHRRIYERKRRTKALVERDIHAVRTRVYAMAALRRHFLAEYRERLARILALAATSVGIEARHD
jgi:hypothetical protein